MNGKMNTLENKSIDDLFKEADMLINRCRKNLDEAAEDVKKLESMDYPGMMERMAVVLVANEAYDLLDESKNNLEYN